MDDEEELKKVVYLSADAEEVIDRIEQEY